MGIFAALYICSGQLPWVNPVKSFSLQVTEREVVPWETTQLCQIISQEDILSQKDHDKNMTKTTGASQGDSLYRSPETPRFCLYAAV